MDRYIEVILFIPHIRTSFAQIPIDAGGAQHRSGHTILKGNLGSQFTNPQQSVQEERVLRQKGFIFIEALRQDLEKVAYCRFEFNRDIPPHSTWAEISCHHPLT